MIFQPRSDAERIDALFAIERETNGLGADQRKAVGQDQSAPLLASLKTWMRQERAKLSRHHAVAKAILIVVAAFPSRLSRHNFATRQVDFVYQIKKSHSSNQVVVMLNLEVSKVIDPTHTEVLAFRNYRPFVFVDPDQNNKYNSLALHEVYAGRVQINFGSRELLGVPRGISDVSARC